MNRFNPDDEKLMAKLAGSVEDISQLHDLLKHRPDHGILDENGEVIAFIVYDEDGALNLNKLREWAMWFEKNPHQRIHERTEVGDHAVSTVFLGLDHQYVLGARPLWFETMVFGPPEEIQLPISERVITQRKSLWSERCATRTEAIAMHAEGLAWLDQYLNELRKNPGQNQKPSPVLGEEPEAGGGD